MESEDERKLRNTGITPANYEFQNNLISFATEYQFVFHHIIFFSF